MYKPPEKFYGRSIKTILSGSGGGEVYNMRY